MNSVFLLSSIAFSSFGQNGAGSVTTDNSSVIIESGTVELRFSEKSYFGPNTHWEINGTLEIWSKEIWVAPTATFSGTGRIILHDPGTNPFYEGMPSVPTVIDGNGGTFIGVDVELRNPKNLILDNITDPGFLANNPDATAPADLHLGATLYFAVDEGDVLLNSHDLALNEVAGFDGYSPKRMVVTSNSIEGHLVKMFSGADPFVFPVGIAEEDYTPATLIPQEGATLHVSVQDYQGADLEFDEEEKGMDRAWHVYGDKSVKTIYTLQHNSITNGSFFADASAEIVQYAGSGNWIGDATNLDGEGVHTRPDVMTVTDVFDFGSWATKLGIPAGPVAVDDEREATSGMPVDILVLENDSPGSSPILVSSVTILTGPVNGTVRVNPDGSITYTSIDGYVGQDSFVYEITDENGLKAQATVYITIDSRPLFIPNVYTPNGDGRNDRFEIVGLENYDRAELVIFNRWGNEVYRANDYQNEWDGNGLSEGTYYYLLTVYKDNNTQVYKGWVLIKR